MKTGRGRVPNFGLRQEGIRRAIYGVVGRLLVFVHFREARRDSSWRWCSTGHSVCFDSTALRMF